MTKAQANKLADDICNSDADVIVHSGYIKFDRKYALRVTDNKTGHSFNVWERSEWNTRRADAEIDYSNLR